MSHMSSEKQQYLGPEKMYFSLCYRDMNSRLLTLDFIVIAAR